MPSVILRACDMKFVRSFFFGDTCSHKSVEDNWYPREKVKDIPTTTDGVFAVSLPLVQFVPVCSQIVLTLLALREHESTSSAVNSTNERAE